MNNCKNCGGAIRFSPENKANVCHNCGTHYVIKYDSNVSRREYLKDAFVPKLKDEYQEMRQVKCNACGGAIVLDKNDMQTLCPYCGNSEIVETTNNWLLDIDSIIPFSFSKEKVKDKIISQGKKSIFVDNKLLQKIDETNISGLYANSYIFDVKSNSTYSGTLAVTTTKRRSNGSSYTTTSYRPIAGKLDKDINNIVIETNSNISQEDMQSILPFDYSGAVKFEREFMNGYILEYQDEDIKTAYDKMRNVLNIEIEKAIKNKYLHGRITELKINTDITSAKYNYTLLPLYIANVKKKEKTRKILVNGQTGKTNNLSKSAGKITLFVLILLFGIGIVAGFAFMFMNMFH